MYKIIKKNENIKLTKLNKYYSIIESNVRHDKRNQYPNYHRIQN